MKSVIQCPSEAELAAFIRGEVPADRVESIAEHLDACAQCRARWEQDPGENAFDDDLKWAERTGREVQVDVSIPLRQLRAALPEYEITREIGRGGMGIVYAARHLTLNRDVALKVLPALLGAVRTGAIERFKREAELTARLKHNNIISVFDYGELDGTYYYTMELVSGRSLKEILEEIAASGAIDVVLDIAGSSATPSSSDIRSCEIPISHRHSPESLPASASSQERIVAAATARKDSRTSNNRTTLGSSARSNRAYYRRVATWVAEVAEAVQYAHEHGVIHRDIKPSNLMLTADGRVMITDFGLARAADCSGMTVSRALLGTARYMSPEQADTSLGPIDAKTDIYGLGATFYELLTFRAPYAGTDDREVIHRLLNQPPVPPRRIVPQVPWELETICLKAIEKERNERYPSAQEMADDLRRWLLDLPIHAKRPSALVRARKFVRRRRLPVALGVACLALLIAGGSIYAAYRSSHHQAEISRATILAQQIELALNDAEKSYDTGQFAEALAAVRAGLRTEPQSGDLRRLEARALVLLDRDGEAYAVLNEHLQSAPKDWQAHYLLARLLTDPNRESAVRTYAPASATIPGLSANEQQQEYALHSQRVLELAPDSTESFVVRAIDATDPAQAVGWLNQALERCPMMPEALIRRAARHEQLHDTAAWLADAERLAAARPGWDFVQMGLGRVLAEVGRHADAEAAYGRAIELSPGYAAHWHNRSVLKSSLGRFREALVDADEAIKLDPKFTYAYAARARAYAGLGQYENALDDHEQALAQRPDDIELYHERSKLNFDTGHVEASIADMTRVLVLKPDDARAFGNRAVAYIMLNQLERAIEDLTRNIEISPQDARAYRNRAHALALLERHDAAIQDYAQAIEIDPTVPGDRICRGNLLLAVGRYEGAIADFTTLLEGQPESDVLLLKRGMAYELSGALRLALSDYDAVAARGGPAGDYAVLWAYVARALTKDAQVSSDALADAKPSGWPARLFELFRGKRTADELLDAAATDDESSEAYYYIGVRALIEGDTTAARAAFEACIGVPNATVTELDFARARLRTIQAGEARAGRE